MTSTALKMGLFKKSAFRPGFKNGSSHKRRTKPKSLACKRLLSVLIDQDSVVCTLQTFDGGEGCLTEIREFGIELFSEEASVPITLSALLTEFIGKNHSVDAAFVYLGENITEAHSVMARGMAHDDVLAAIDNNTFWSNTIVTARDIEEQSVCFELFNSEETVGSGVGVEAVLVDRKLLFDINSAIDSLKLQCLSISPFGCAVAGCFFQNFSQNTVGVDINSDGRAHIYFSEAGRCSPVEVYLSSDSSNFKQFNAAASLEAVTSNSNTMHPIWSLEHFSKGLDRDVIFNAPQDYEEEFLRGSKDHVLSKFEVQIDKSAVEEQLARVSSRRRNVEIIYMAQYTQYLCAANLGDPPRSNELNFLDTTWDLFARDRQRSQLYRSMLISGTSGAAFAACIIVVAELFLPDYHRMELENEQTKAEILLLDTDILTVQQDFEMLSLREKAIAQISGNHRDVYEALISLFGMVPSQVQLSRVSVEGESGNVYVEGVGSNEIAISNFVGELSKSGQARASLLRLSVNDEMGFSFLITIPYADLY